jgi:RimJ/RimL family protein N-acetyltransferase
MPGTPIVETDRLLLRHFDEGDVDAYFVLGSDPAIIRYTGDPNGGLKSRDDALAVLRARPLADYAKYGYGRWACVDKASGAVIGFAGLKYLEDVQEVDLGYRFVPAFWGRGLATEAARAVLDHGFARLGLDCVVGYVAPDNRASMRVLEKLGFAGPELMLRWGLHVARYVIRAADAERAGRVPIQS